jgi:chemotaxis methyl-accepting protein methylase
MDNNEFKIGALRHVRFAGRPTITVSHFTERTNPILAVAKYATANRCNRPGQFISWVFERAGLSIDSYRGDPLQRRLSACLRALHAETEAHAHALLERKPDLLPKALDALLIGVTEFFRDPSVFEALRTEIPPRLSLPSRPLRVWSAGCSNGAELYSMAVLLDQIGLLEGSFLLGSDCRRAAIERAQTALYNSSELRNMVPPDRHRYFNDAGSFCHPIELLRCHVNWKVADLARGIEEGPWDIILWRNMAIYLNADAAESVWQGLASSMTPEGLLIVGRAERPPKALPLINVRRCIYRFGSPKDSRTLMLRPQRTSNSHSNTLETHI